MSYCRFSSDNWKSDVYAWADCGGGYRTEVAANRIVGDVPPIPRFDSVSKEEFIAAMKAQSEFLDDCKRENIGLSRDGQGFHDDTPQELLERFLSLREEGYHVPDSAIECVREEVLEQMK
jgi:hypothetical protein